MLVPSLVLSNGRWQLAVAALAAPFFARLFLMSQPAVKGLLIMLPLQLGAYLIMWWEVIPAPGVLYYIIAASYGLCYFLPFVVDRIASPRLPGFASTLVLPLSWFLVEILIQLLTPYGSWSSVGYTQMDHAFLTPLAAWVGVAGVAFVTVWAASVASWIVIAKTPMRSRILTFVFWTGSIVVSVFLAKTPPAIDLPNASNVPVAAITPSNETTLRVHQAVQVARESGEFSPEILARLDGITSELNDGLMMRSRDASRKGARLIVWSETAGRILGSQEDRLIARGQELAREEGIYLFMGLGVLHPGKQPPLENKVIAITPSGEIAWQYRKARPIVGSEAPFLPPGHNDLATLDTPFGRVGLVICHDLDFADFVAQAGRKEVELMIVPSADWPVIADIHADMGIMRAVENGFSLLRPAHDGLSVIASPQGHVIVSEYDAELEDRVFAGQVPIARTDTIYPHVRPYLPFGASVLLVGLFVIAWRKP
jgi:apolipoprotein N-acyltransferase